MIRKTPKLRGLGRHGRQSSVWATSRDRGHRTNDALQELRLSWSACVARTQPPELDEFAWAIL